MSSIGWDVGPIDQLCYGIQLVFSAFKKKGQWSSPLRSWVSIPLMYDKPIAFIFILIFNLLMMVQGKKLGTALKEYHKDVPELAECARILNYTWI